MNQPQRNFITESERTAFAAGNELTDTGSASPPSPLDNMSDAEALRALIAAAKEMASEPVPDPSPFSPTQETETKPKEKKEASAKKAKEGRKGADPFLAPPDYATRSELENAVKLRIIELFAQFYTAASIVQLIDIEFGKRLNIKQIASFDPSKPSSRVGKKLRAMYDQMRADYVSKSSAMAMTHQSHRLRLIGDIVEKATNSKDYNAALKGLELAAKEMGGVLEGKQTVTHVGAVTHIHSVEDARAEVAMRLQQIVDGGLLLPAPPSSPSSPDNSLKSADIPSP